MLRKTVGPFKYYTGIHSLADIATRDDRVCVLNILGGESSEVTPVGHAWSGGNVVFGTSPGKKGQVLETPAGNIPVYDNVREGLEDGHRFNCGVVYLPPSAADDGVVELIRVNDELTKIFIPTEKMSVHDAREIRAMAQARGIDIFETFRAMADALREHFGKYGAQPLYVVVGRGGPNLVRGMGVLRDTCESLGIPYRLFGFDSAMSEVVDYAKRVDTWMKAGGRAQIAAAMKLPAPASASAAAQAKPAAARQTA